MPVTTPSYVCPTCGQTLERDLLLFVRHTDEHILEEIKRHHPTWITREGYCPACMDYFKKAFGKPRWSYGEAAPVVQGSEAVNLGARGVRSRRLFGVFSLAATFLAWWVIGGVHSPRPSRWILFIPLFAAALGFLQARRRLCVVLAAGNRADLDGRVVTIADRASAHALRWRAAGIVAWALAASAVASAALVLF